MPTTMLNKPVIFTALALFLGLTVAFEVRRKRLAVSVGSSCSVGTACGVGGEMLQCGGDGKYFRGVACPPGTVCSEVAPSLAVCGWDNNPGTRPTGSDNGQPSNGGGEQPTGGDIKQPIGGDNRQPSNGGSEQPTGERLKAKQCPCGQGYKCMSTLNSCVLDVQCSAPSKPGNGPPASCQTPTDPQNKPPSGLEKWFTKEVFADLFPHANIGWGPNDCWPYSYEAFKIAARYFPTFGTEAPNNGYTAQENYRRDLAAFFAHSIQETGENTAEPFSKFQGDLEKANACFYRGGLYNWFEGGPVSCDVLGTQGTTPQHGAKCTLHGRYCSPNSEWPCSEGKDGQYYTGCYFGRGPIQISYNFNYGQFQDFLKKQGIDVNLLKEPNLVMTKMDPPLGMMASLWFYMTPQLPKPSMHDVILGKWTPSAANKAAGFFGPIFGPTSLIINNECQGESSENPGPEGESRRIKAFRWFTEYFNVPAVQAGNDKTLSCRGMQRF